MSKKHLSRDSRSFRQASLHSKKDGQWWWYEEPTGIAVFRASDARHNRAFIPVDALRRYLEHLDRKDS